MRILAIDPGNEKSSWVLLCDGAPKDAGTDPNADVSRRLSFFANADLVAIEMIASYGMAVGREVFETCLWIGRFLATCESGGVNLATRLVYRRDVKLYICGSVRATDANIRASLMDRFGPGKDKAVGKKRTPGPLYGLKGGEWSALGVAVTAAWQDEIKAVQPDPVLTKLMAARSEGG